MMVLDGAKEGVNNHRAILERELETVGLRLNKRPPNVYFRKKKDGGVKFNSTLALTKLGSDPAHTVKRVLSEYKIHNCEVLVREDVGVDDIVDVIQGNRKYIKCLYVYNKVDMITIEDMDKLAREPNSIVVSVHMQLNLDSLLECMWDYMGLIRVFTKKKGHPPDFSDPVILSSERGGVLVKSAAQHISKEMVEVFNYALVWGRSTKHDPQRCGLAHSLMDEDVLQIVPKTINQQKRSKNYVRVAQGAKDALAARRKKKPLKT
ncbi:unnamed protein product [Discosporangium mesarthrocarpum]